MDFYMVYGIKILSILFLKIKLVFYVICITI